MFLLDKYLLFGSTQEDNFVNIKARNLAEQSIDAEGCESGELFILLFLMLGHRRFKALSKLIRDSGFWVAVTDTESPLIDNTECRQEERQADALPLTQGGLKRAVEKAAYLYCEDIGMFHLFPTYVISFGK